MRLNIPAIVIREPGRTALHVLVMEPIYVGRGGSGILLDDPQVSRQHLELIPEQEGLWIRDCESTHGTSLDDVPVNVKVMLVEGSVVRLGNVTIELYNCGGSAVGQLNSTATDSNHPQSSIERIADLVSPEDTKSISKKQSEQTLTIVFSDIEGSSKMALAVGDNRWFEILTAHNELLRESMHKYGGTEVKSIGDGFMLTFLSARGAIDALIEIQQALNSVDRKEVLRDIRIRAGIHVGEAIVDEDGDLFGHHVNIAARIADKAKGGEILVSPLVREITEARGDLVFDNPRTVSLKGIAQSYLVHPVIWR